MRVYMQMHINIWKEQSMNDNFTGLRGNVCVCSSVVPVLMCR